MRSIIQLQEFWKRRGGEPLALCTIVAKEHSGYRSIGAKKIVARDGGSCGVLSGGCLEGDIERLARDNWDAMPFIESFSTMAEGDRLMGYQTGCAGKIRILFERLPAQTSEMELYLPYGADRKAAGVAVSLRGESMAERRFCGHPASANDNLFFDPWVQPVGLHVVGCGVDAHPFAEMVPPLGWQLRFLDYRTDVVLPVTCTPYRAEVFQVNELPRQIPEGMRNAVVLMTHNYEADLEIMAQLADKRLGYIGCLGPRKRYEQLKDDLASMRGITLDPDWESRVHAPAGLFTGGREPECIALSVIAQVQSLLRSA